MEKTVTIRNASLTVKTSEGFEIPMKDLFNLLEKEIIQSYLKKNFNNKNTTSKELCVNRTTLVEKCRKFGLFMNPSPSKRVKRVI